LEVFDWRRAVVAKAIQQNIASRSGQFGRRSGWLGF